MNSGFLDRLKRLGVAPNGKIDLSQKPTIVTPRSSDLPRRPSALDATLGIPGLRREASAWVVDSESDPEGLHGSVALSFNAGTWPILAAVASRDARFRDIPVEDWCFIDTETTSLNSGAGVWVFLVGVGRFQRGRFTVRQHLLAGPEHEDEFLGAVGADLSRARALVSFHGKSFDAPRIDDRFRLMGLSPHCQGVPHLDLIHPVRRMVRTRWPDVRLRTVEERWLDFIREDDLPGSLCPTQFFSWLRGEQHRMAAVFEHNRLDIVSLAALTRVLLDAYNGDRTRGCQVAVGLDYLLASETERAFSRLEEGLNLGTCTDRGLIVQACHAAIVHRRLGLARAYVDRMRSVHPQDVKTPVLAERLARLATRLARAQFSV